MEKELKKYWEGKYPLVQSYWIGCVVIPLVLSIPFAFVTGNVSSGAAFFLIIYWIFLIGANAFLLIGGFKSATIYVKEKQRKKKNSGWGIAAQILIVLGGIYTVLEVLKVLLS
tara:strand:+ start:178 stop:516 length:339 start_codon:yes stop_codon:yes gene_type:complete